MENEKTVWKIKSDSEAEWWIDKKNEELEEVERLEVSIKDKIQMLNEKLETVRKEKNQILEDRDFRLREYFTGLDNKQLKESKTQLKYRLPSGDLVMKKAKPDFKRTDDNLIKWLEHNEMDEYIEIKKQPKWGELKKNVIVAGDKVVIKDTGEIVEGIEVLEKPEEFEVKL